MLSGTLLTVNGLAPNYSQNAFHVPLLTSSQSHVYCVICLWTWVFVHLLNCVFATWQNLGEHLRVIGVLIFLYLDAVNDVF